MSFEKVLTIPDTQKIFLAFLKPAHRIDGEAWAQHVVYTNCYWIVYSHGDVVEVKEDDDYDYSEYTNLIDLNNSPTGFFYDEAEEKLYLHTSGSDDPVNYIIQSYFWIKITNLQPVDDPIIYNGDYFLPYLKAENLPAISMGVNEIFVGGTTLSFGTVSFINDGWWDTALNIYSFERKDFYLQLGGKRHGILSFGDLFTGITGDVSWSEEEVGIEIMDNRYAIFKNPLTTAFDIITFPYMDPAWEGKAIPTGYGSKEDVQPVLIDSRNLDYKICIRELDSIDEVRAGGIPLTEDVEYETDLPDGEFTLNGCPWLAGGTTYYLVISTEDVWGIDPLNHIRFMVDDGAGYADGQLFEIKLGDFWTGAAKDVNFQLISKEADAVTANESLLVSFLAGSDNLGLKDIIGRFKLGQSFEFAGVDQKIVKIKFQVKKIGVPVGNLRIEIHSDKVGTRVGGWATIDMEDIATGGDYAWHEFEFIDYDGSKEIEADFTTGDDTAREILEHALEHLMNMNMDLIDEDLMDDLEAKRTEILGVFLDQDITGEGFVNKLGITSAFHFVPLPGGTFGPIVFAAGEPADTPHLFDEDYISFKQQREPENVILSVVIKYGQDPISGEWLQVKRTSTTSGILYGATEILELETWLTSKADAETLGDLILGTVEQPKKKLFITLSVIGFTMYPGQKIKVWRTRADNDSGVFNGVLYRIIKMVANSSNGTVSMECWRDTQSY